MAYNKAFNPDALPAHAEPEQAAQALSQLQLQANRKPSPNSRYANQAPLNPNPPPPSSSGPRRTSPAGASAQNSYRPPPAPNASHPRPPPNQGYGDSQFHRLQSPPPPANYGYGPRPQPGPPGPPRPSNEAHHYPARTSAPPDPDSVDLVPLFRAANASGTGSLSTPELGSALVNADFTPFDSLTITSLMRMFTTSPPNQPHGPTITFPEFESLWRFLAAWRTLFERFDEDGSGRMSLGEFSSMTGVQSIIGE